MSHEDYDYENRYIVLFKKIQLVMLLYLLNENRMKLELNYTQRTYNRKTFKVLLIILLLIPLD